MDDGEYAYETDWGAVIHVRVRVDRENLSTRLSCTCSGRSSTTTSRSATAVCARWTSSYGAPAVQTHMTDSEWRLPVQLDEFALHEPMKVSTLSQAVGCLRTA